MARIRRILHASDFSHASKAAFAKAVELAKGERAALTIMHVMAPIVPYVGEAYAAPQVYERMLADVRAHSQKELDKLVAKAKSSKVRTVGLLQEGLPHDRIVRAAKARRADLIVIGTHGRTGLARLFLGSVAGRVIASAPCPVLTVRGK